MPPKKTTTVKAGAKPAAKSATKTGAKAPAKGKMTGKAAAAAAAPSKEEPKPVKRESMTIDLKKIKPVLISEPDNAILKSGKTPVLVDPSTRALTLLRYGDEVILIDAFDKSPMEAEKLRQSLLFALRWGRTIVFNMEESDLTNAINTAWDALSPGLWPKIIDRSITNIENIKTLIRETDVQELNSEYQYLDENTKQFRCILYTSQPDPSDNLQDNYYCVLIEQ